MTLGSTMFSRRSGRRQTRGDVVASHRGLGQSVQWGWHASFDSLPPRQLKQLLQLRGSGPGGGKSEIVPCDGLMTRLHYTCCSGARFNVYPHAEHYRLYSP